MLGFNKYSHKDTDCEYRDREETCSLAMAEHYVRTGEIVPILCSRIPDMQCLRLLRILKSGVERHEQKIDYD